MVRHGLAIEQRIDLDEVITGRLHSRVSQRVSQPAVDFETQLADYFRLSNLLSEDDTPMTG